MITKKELLKTLRFAELELAISETKGALHLITKGNAMFQYYKNRLDEYCLEWKERTGREYRT